MCRIHNLLTNSKKVIFRVFISIFDLKAANFKSKWVGINEKSYLTFGGKKETFFRTKSMKWNKDRGKKCGLYCCCCVVVDRERNRELLSNPRVIRQNTKQQSNKKTKERKKEKKQRESKEDELLFLRLPSPFSANLKLFRMFCPLYLSLSLLPIPHSLNQHHRLHHSTYITLLNY